MPDITWPVDGGYAFWPEAHDEALEYQVELTVKRNGGVETLSLPGALWTSTLRFDDAAVSRREERARLQAFLATLRGGANRLLLWNLAQPEPLGNARGSVTLAAGVAAGATSAQLQGCAASPNLLTHSSFELDSNADGVSDAWSTYSSGAVGGLTYIRPAGFNSATAQGVSIASLGAAAANAAGVRLTGNIPVTAGQVYSFAADCIANSAAVSIGLWVDWFNSGGTFLSSSRNGAAAAPLDWTRRTVTLTAPAGAAQAKPYVWVEGFGTAVTSLLAYFDNVQFEVGAQATGYAGLARLLRGDRLAWDGQRVMVTADATATDAGAMNIQFEPARRAASLSGAAVTLVRPTTRYVVTSPVVPMPAMGTVLPGFAIELVEA